MYARRSADHEGACGCPLHGAYSVFSRQNTQAGLHHQGGSCHCLHLNLRLPPSAKGRLIHWEDDHLIVRCQDGAVQA